jgi:hypothetical protein
MEFKGKNLAREKSSYSGRFREILLSLFNTKKGAVKKT